MRLIVTLASPVLSQGLLFIAVRDNEEEGEEAGEKAKEGATMEDGTNSEEALKSGQFSCRFSLLRPGPLEASRMQSVWL